MKEAGLKVFGVNLDGRYRGIVAASSQIKAAALLRIPVSHIREYGCQTYNPEEVALAMREPGKAWKKNYWKDSEWVQIYCCIPERSV